MWYHAQALASIAEMTSLTSLSLCDCSALTNNGMLVRSPAVQGNSGCFSTVSYLSDPAPAIGTV